MDDIIPENVPQKQCSKCNKIFPATFEFFFRHKHGKYGLRSICKACTRITGAEPPPHGTMKRCSKCKEWKSATIEFFARSRNRRDGLQHICKICLRHASDPSVYDIPEGYKRCTSCRQTLPATSNFFYPKKRRDGTYGLAGKCSKCANQAAQEYYREHAEDYRPYYQQYRQTHREQCQANGHNRRARERAAPGKHNAADIKKLFSDQKGKCYYCQAVLKKGKRAYHVDHVIPLSRGGSNGPENLVITCPTCNLSKKDKLPHEWPKGGRLL